MNVTTYENDTMEKLEDFSILYLDYILIKYLHFYILHLFFTNLTFPFMVEFTTRKEVKINYDEPFH